MSRLVSFLLKMMVSSGKKVAKELEVTTSNPQEEQEKLLKSIIEKASDTEFGRKYNFSEIKTVEDYERLVPLASYDSLHESIDRMIDGKEKILTHDEVVHFNVTSGTMGTPKNIPVTEEQVSLFAKFNSRYLNYVVAKSVGTAWTKGKGISLSEGSCETLPSGATIGSASSLIASRMQHGKASDPSEMMYTSPSEARRPATLGVYTRYLHALFALREKNVTYGNVTFSSNLLEFMRFIEINREALCKDIEFGTLDGILEMPNEERESVLKKLSPMPERAAELRAIFENHLNEPFGKLIWPKLTFFMCVAGAGFQTYTDKVLERYLGSDVHILYLGLTSSEGFFSAPIEMDKEDAVFVPNGNYMEFIPIVDDERDLSQGIKHLWELELGKKYELVITNLSGLFRYELKDVIEVTGFYNKTPTMRFASRSGFAINICAEKTSYTALQFAAEQTCKELGLDMYDYCVCPFQDDTGSRYIFMYELNSIPEDLDKAKLRDVTEKHLADFNMYYSMALKLGYIRPTEVRLLQSQTFMLYRDIMIMKGRSVTQLKPVHVTSNPFQEKFFLNLEEK